MTKPTVERVTGREAFNLVIVRDGENPPTVLLQIVDVGKPVVRGRDGKPVRSRGIRPQVVDKVVDGIRVCTVCGSPLSRYNPGKVCSSCAM